MKEEKSCFNCRNLVGHRADGVDWLYCSEHHDINFTFGGVDGQEPAKDCREYVHEDDGL